MAEHKTWQSEVEAVLTEATGGSARVDFFYPEIWDEASAQIAYRLAGRRDIRADDKPFDSVVTIYIDIWSRDPALVNALAQQCGEALENVGWIFDDFSNDMYEQDSRRHHRIERYRRE